MNDFMNNWRDFLTEKTAAAKRGVHVPSAKEGIAKYVDDSDTPKYFITFSDINKLGINPRSEFNTPLGIYSYVLSPQFVNKLLRGVTAFEFAGERKFAHIFKVREGITGVLYNSGGDTISTEQLHEYMNILFSPGLLSKYDTPFLNRVNEEREGKSLILRAISEEEAEPFVDYVMEQARETSPKAARMLERRGAMPFLRAWAEYTLQAPYGKVNKKKTRLEFWQEFAKQRGDKKAFEERFRGGATHTAVLYDYAKVIDDTVHDVVGKALKEDAEREVPQSSPSHFDMRLYPALPQNVAWEEKFYELAIVDPPSGNEREPWEVPIVKEVMEDARTQTNIGQLWNLTRVAAQEDPRAMTQKSTYESGDEIPPQIMRRWSYILTDLGVHGVVDVGNQGMIHPNEPEQAVFFGRQYIDSVETFRNRNYEAEEEARNVRRGQEKLEPILEKVLGRKLNKREKYILYQAASYFSWNLAPYRAETPAEVGYQVALILAYHQLSLVYRDVLTAYGFQKYGPKKWIGTASTALRAPRVKSPLEADFVRVLYDGYVKAYKAMRAELRELRNNLPYGAEESPETQAQITKIVQKFYPQALQGAKEYRDYFMKDANFIRRGIEEVEKNRVKPGRNFSPEISKLLADLQAVLDAQQRYIKES